MSISFAKNQTKISEIIDVFDAKAGTEEVIKYAINFFIKKFDDHFLKYISYRKQRDLMIVNCFFSFILQDVKMDNKLCLKYDFVENLFTNKKCDFQDILPINSKEIILNLEQEIAILKTFKEFFNDIKKKISFDISHGKIDAKISKVMSLKDDFVLNKLTKSENIKKRILANLGCIKDYSVIFSNSILLHSLQEEFYVILRSKL